MKIDRLFVTEGNDPYSFFEYEQHRCVITHHVTKEVKRDYTAEVPKHWSLNAKNVMIDKYMRKGGVPAVVEPAIQSVDEVGLGIPDWLKRSVAKEGQGIGGEWSIKGVVHRMVGHWTYTGFKRGYFAPSESQKPLPRTQQNQCSLTEQNAKAFYDELVFMLLNQMAAPNSPQWFNTGLYWAYGIEGSKTGMHWYVDDDAMRRVDGLRDENVPLVQHNQIIVKHLQQSVNVYQRVQAHACFILTVNDTMFNKENGIFDWYNAEGLIFKYGSGSGANLSNIRAKGESLSGGGKSSGLMSWMRVADYSAGAIKSGGTTRRAAKMVVLDLDHPDIKDFINCKMESEIAAASLVTGSAAIKTCLQEVMDSVRLLMDIPNNVPVSMLTAIKDHDVNEAIKNASNAGVPDNYIAKAIAMSLQGFIEWPGEAYSTEYEGEAYQIVPFQNANHSVRIPAKFYDAVDANGDWSTRWRTTKDVAWSIAARELESEIAKATWFSGDPGVQFDDNINDWNVTPADGLIRASNPCSEHLRLDDTACNLASIRLMQFYRNGKFQIKEFQHAVHLWQMVLDITIDMSHFPTRQVALGAYNYRDTGLGYCDLGALIMANGLAYDSDAGRALAGAVTALMHSQAHLTSAMLAKFQSPYPRFNFNRAAHLKCVRNHRRAADEENMGDYESLSVSPPKINWSALGNFDVHACVNIRQAVFETYRQAYRLGEVHGFRNAQMTLLAPTGTISIVMDCDTTGVEPMLGLLVRKTLAGGGTMMLEPAGALKMGLLKRGYNPDHVIEKMKINVDGLDVDVIKLKINDSDLHLTDTSLPDPLTKRVIPWQAHIDMMAAVQTQLSGAISKTVNMSAHAEIEDVRRAYRMAHDKGVKAVAIYRDGCKLSQPLNILGLSKKIDRITATSSEVIIENAAKPAIRLSPEIPPGGRMLLNWHRDPGIDIKVKIGGGSLYLRTVRYPDGRCAEIWATYSADQGIIMALLGSVCKTANIALQWGVPLQNIINSWQDTIFEPKGFVGEHPYVKTASSILNLIARLLDYHELGNTSGLNIKPNANLSQQDITAIDNAIHDDPAAYNKVKITGETCPRCGSQQYIFSGANCKKCLECGEAGGCG